jgi:hypothetical protein
MKALARKKITRAGRGANWVRAVFLAAACAEHVAEVRFNRSVSHSVLGK